MLMGVVIYDELAAWCGAESLTVSLRGLRYGALVLLNRDGDDAAATSS